MKDHLKRIASSLPALAAVLAAVGIILLDKGDARDLWIILTASVVGGFLVVWFFGWTAFRRSPNKARPAVECGRIVGWGLGVLVAAGLIYITQELLPELLPGKQNEDNVDLIATAVTAYATTVFLDEMAVWNPVKSAMASRFKGRWYPVTAGDPDREVKESANEAVTRLKLPNDVGWDSWSDRSKRVKLVQAALDAEKARTTK